MSLPSSTMSFSVRSSGGRALYELVQVHAAHEQYPLPDLAQARNRMPQFVINVKSAIDTRI